MDAILCELHTQKNALNKHMEQEASFLLTLTRQQGNITTEEWIQGLEDL